MKKILVSLVIVAAIIGVIVYLYPNVIDITTGAVSGSRQYLGGNYATTTPTYVSTSTPVATFTYSENLDNYDAMNLCMWAIASTTVVRIDFYPEVSHNKVDWFSIDSSFNVLGATTTNVLNVASTTYTWLPAATNSVGKCITIDYAYGSYFRVKFVRAGLAILSNNYSLWASLTPQSY
uniref:Uncharacterized protein n=1 Tax=viral metagenome TaxID=1070528 RepID=A0A6M3IU86_9ZZZZ